MNPFSRHFSRAELLDLASCSEEIPATERGRLLLHLGGNCQMCRSQWLPAKGEESDACPPQTADLRDPLLRALRRWLPAPSQALEADRLWPRHLYLATQPRAPLAFLRLLIEEAADLEASGSQKIDAMLERAFHDLALFAEALEAEPELPLSPPARDQSLWDPLLADLEGLTFTYLARERRYDSDGTGGSAESSEAWAALALGTAGRLVERLRDSSREEIDDLPHGSAWAEVGRESFASLVDLEGRWALAAEDFERAGQRFSTVAATLASSKTPGRTFETELGPVRIALLEGHHSVAETHLGNIARSAYSSYNPRLMLEARFLTSLQLVSSGRLEEARAELVGQKTLCGQIGAATVEVRWLITKAWLDLQLQGSPTETTGRFLSLLLEDWRSRDLTELARRLADLGALGGRTE